MKFDFIQMMSRLHSFFKSPITDPKLIDQGYTNTVYEFTTNDKKYIYKEYDSVNENEINVLKRITTPKIILNEKLYRIEEYLEHEDIDYLRDMKEIVGAMGEMHSLETDEVEGFDALINRLHSEAVASLKCGITDTKKDLLQQKKALEELKSRVEILFASNKYREALCHNDLQPNNMLKVKDKIIIIDYEFTTVGDVLFDIANLFCETHFDYITYEYSSDFGYKEDDEKEFLKLYLGDVTEDILMKINNFKIISHYIWFLWTIPKLNQNTNKKFKYSKYALERLKAIKTANFVSEEEEKVLRSILDIKEN